MSDATCHFVRFGLIVTGETEREHLLKMFKSLMASGVCHFKVIRFIGQRDPITSSRRKLEMVGSGKVIPDKDATEIGFPARRYLISNQCNLVVLVDDLERHREEEAHQIFARYRQALDAVLSNELQPRAAVHFLVNMLEAYYFAHADAINKALDLDSSLSDCTEDVEAIHNPKSELKQLWVFWILPGNSLSSPKSSQELRVCGDYRPFSRRYWVVGGDDMIAPGEFLKSHNYILASMRLRTGARYLSALTSRTFCRVLRHVLGFGRSSLGVWRHWKSMRFMISQFYLRLIVFVMVCSVP